MKTAAEKAEQFIDGFKGKDGVRYEFSEELELNLLAGIRILLKEQDRDTRHACAEAVRQCEDASILLNIVDTDRAMAACMNVAAL